MNVTISRPFSKQYAIDNTPFLLAGGNIIAGTETVPGAGTGTRRG
jgi:hypothetical protein